MIELRNERGGFGAAVFEHAPHETPLVIRELTVAFALRESSHVSALKTEVRFARGRPPPLVVPTLFQFSTRSAPAGLAFT